MTTARPTVTILIPTYREEAHIEDCLGSVTAQTYDSVAEVLVVDGRSDDRTRTLAAVSGATVVDNPGRTQAAALNIGIERAVGDVIVRVDGHCRLSPDYVQRCVEALARTGAAMVGGAMTPVGTTATERAVGAAMQSPLGAGPARFHVGGEAGWVDTVYLGAFPAGLARKVGGYAVDVGVNEDAEFAYRMAGSGGVWFDPMIRSEYRPRGSLRAVASQFYRYGRSRALTLARHPKSLSVRQLAAPGLVVGLLSPWRRIVATAYGLIVGAEAARITARVGPDGVRAAAVLPAMHLPWGIGLLIGLLTRRPVHRANESYEASTN